MQQRQLRSATWGALSLALAVLAVAGATAEEEVWKTIFRGATEVNVINVDVVVTDRDGRPVTDLGIDDFELFDGKEPVEISNFYAVVDGVTVPLDSAGDAGAATGVASAGDALTNPGIADAGDAVAAEGEAAGAPAIGEQAEGARTAGPQPLHLILYVDNINMKRTNRSRAFNHMREFLLAQRQLGARVMLLSNERSLVVRQGFTSVPHELFVALDELEKENIAGPNFDLDRRDVLRAIERVNVDEGSGIFETKQHAGQELIQDIRAPMEQDRLTRQRVVEARSAFTQIQAYSQMRLQHTMQTLDVLRDVIDTAAGLPGRKSVLYVSDGLTLRPGEAIFEAFSRRFETLSDTGGNVHVQAEAARDDATPQLEELLEHANASRVTFYTLDASPAERLSYGAAESDITGGGNTAVWNDSMASTEQHNEQQSLRLLAQDTGGRFGDTEKSWEAVLQGVVTDFDNYYSLGFVADPDEDRAERQLKVTVNRKGLIVRHRSSFRDKPATDLTAERTRAALLLDDMANPFGVQLATDEPELQGDGTYLVPLAVRIPLGKLVLLPGKTEHQGRVSMFVAVRDEKGRTSDVNRHLCPIRIPNDQVLTALGQSAACGLRLKMRRGPQRVAVSVLDELSAIDSTVHLALDVGAGVQTAELASSR